MKYSKIWFKSNMWQGNSLALVSTSIRSYVRLAHCSIGWNAIWKHYNSSLWAGAFHRQQENFGWGLKLATMKKPYLNPISKEKGFNDNLHSWKTDAHFAYLYISSVEFGEKWVHIKWVFNELTQNLLWIIT